MDMELGFLGFGSMGQAIARGLLDAGVLQPGQIHACAAHYEKLSASARALGVHPHRTPAEVVRACDTVILAVIPAAVPEVLALDSQLLEGRMVISIAAGYDFARLHPLLPEIAHHISTIPNTPIAVGRGVLICEDRHSLTDAQLSRLHALFAPVSLMESVPARLFSAAGTLSGCTPAFTAMYLEALADAGVKYGLDRAAACRIAAQVLVGTGTLQLRTGAHPGVIKDGVCSPGGTTIRGVSALEKAAFRGAVIGALDAIEGGKNA